MGGHAWSPKLTGAMPHEAPERMQVGVHAFKLVVLAQHAKPQCVELLQDLSTIAADGIGRGEL